MNVVNITDAPKSKAEKLDLFCEGIANGLSRSAAYEAAGYSAHDCKANANKYYRQNSAYIQAYIAEHIGSHAPTAFKVLLQIMNDPNEKGGIRLKATQDVLDRAGFGAKQKIELTTKDATEMSTEELSNEIARLISENPELAGLFHQKVPMGE
jgi:hypothetical protein